ncbi:MAG: hypothetical protein WAV54_06670 [Acidimicrobiales bacterium]
MRVVLQSVPMDGVVVIGKGGKEGAPGPGTVRLTEAGHGLSKLRRFSAIELG